MLTDFIPLLSVIVGGLLTLLGGLATNYMTQSGSRKEEKRKAYREKLEEIYSLSNQVMNWVEWQNDLNKDKSEDEAPPCPIDRVVLIARLYLPDLIDPAVGFKLEFDRNKNMLKRPQISVPIDDIEDKYRELLLNIESLARKEIK